MSTDLTTTLMLKNEEAEGIRGVRFLHTIDGGIRANIVTGDDTRTSAYFSADDAIMLRDWLNDEWPIHQRTDFGRTASEAMADAVAEQLWADDGGAVADDAGFLDDGRRYARTPWGFVEVVG